MIRKTYRIIKSKLKDDTLIVKTDFGLDVYYKISHTTSVDSITKYDDGIPDFATDIGIDFIKVVKHKKAKTRQEITSILKKESIIPHDLVFDRILLGFVYADNTDPNNFRWWLDFRDAKDQSIYNYYTDDIEINCPITTTKWHDNDPNGIWHGRMVFSPNELQTILEPKPGKLIVSGELRSKISLDTKKICSSQNIPEKTESLRLRYNIREDLWLCDILDKEEKEIKTIPSKSIMCDAKMYGNILIEGDKPKVSVKVKIEDISDMGIAFNGLIIRGK